MANDIEDPSLPLKKFVPICAIGASAGGVGVLQTLFRLLPDDLGLAYVIVVHLSPDHPSAMHEILGACTRMPVFQVLDGPRLQANSVYVIAPDSELVIEGDDVKSRPFSDPRGRRAPIDMFFRSIAAARGDGIAVVLTGAGTDGAVGVRAIKEAGGIVMVQEPTEAGFPSMPQNAIATGVADVVAPVALLAERIGEAARSKEAVRSLDEDGAANDLRRIVAFLRTRTGHDFSGYKRSTVLRRVLRRMQVCLITDLDDYARHLRSTPEEAKALFADLLISVTMFFRDPEAYSSLASQVVQPLLEHAGENGGEGEIRAWVVGCATGEEAYSIAILLLEEAERLKLHVPAQIFATDLDEGALATAREGRYPRSIEADVSPDRLKRFFLDEGTHYRVNRRVRDLVLFATHSVVREPPFMRLDLVTCRNVLIYLERTLQQHVCSLFHYGLKPTGYLFLGTAETADTARSQFHAIDRDARIYQARPQANASLPILPSAPPASWPMASVASAPASVGLGESSGLAHVAALEASAPPSVLVDADFALAHLSPNAGRFMRLPGGTPTLKLASLVRTELQLDLRTALDRVSDTRAPMVTRAVDVAFDGGARRVIIHVAPVAADDGTASQLLVTFLDAGPAGTIEPASSEASSAADEIRHLHADLKTAQEAALAGRISYEAALQELRANNEELQSLNEEYRSTAEELETSKEELQSINEELQTVNAELKAKLSVISAAHDDLQNLTSSSEIGTLFLDTKLRIRMFTPRVAELINVTDVDVGRIVTDLTHRLDYDDIDRDVRQVLRDLAPVEKEIRGLGDRWFVLRIRPYRTLDNRIEGAVVTFDEVTERKRGEIALMASEAQFRAFVQASSDAIYRMSPDWREMLSLEGRAFMADTRAPSDAWEEDYIDAGDRAQIREAIADAIRQKVPFDLEHRVRRSDGSLGWTHSRAVPLLDADGRIVQWLGTAKDVTARREAEAALRESDMRLRAVFSAMDEGYLLADVITDEEGRAVDIAYLDSNPAATRMVGADLTGRRLREVSPDYEEYWYEIWGRVATTGRGERLERYAAPDDRWYSFYVFKLDPEDRDSRRIAVVFQDVSEQRRREQALRESEALQRALIEGTPQIVWRAKGDGAWTWASPQWTAYTGQREGESHGDGWVAALHPDDRERVKTAWTLAAHGEPFDMEVRVRHAASDTYRWFQSRALPLRDRGGTIIEWLGTSTDVDDLRRLQDRQGVLVAELQHRTRNLMSVVGATADATLRSSADLRDFEVKFSDRIAALSRVQGLLARLSDGERVTFDELLRSELAAVGGDRGEGQVVLDGPPGVALRSSTVQTFALAIHELATNAVKYGAFRQPSGRLSVTWSLAPADEKGRPWLHVEWRETGVAMPLSGSSPQGTGQGRELIERALPYQLGARTTFVMAEDGVRCTIAMPVSSRAQDAGTDHG